MNFKKLLAEKQALEETKSRIKIAPLKERQPRRLRIVKPAELCDQDVLEYHDKLKEIAITHGAPLTHRMKIKAA